MPAERSAPLTVAEPTGRYAPRSPLVIDCSVLAAVLFDEPAREIAADAMSGHTLYAPDLLVHEMVSVALKKHAQGPEEVALPGLNDLADLQLSFTRVQPTQQFHLGARHDLSAYDAAYLQLAIELRAPLATFDQRLGAAAAEVLGGNA